MVIDTKWADGKVVEVVIYPLAGKESAVRYGSSVNALNLAPGEVFVFKESN